MSRFQHGITVYGAPLLPGVGGNVIAGDVYFVDSGNALASNNTSSGTKDVPFASMHYADQRCTANNGDVVFVLPGHTETVIAAAGCDLNTAGVTWIGIGSGSNRPTVNFTTAVTADLNIDGANITMVNFLFTGGIDALTAPIDVNAADCKLINCEWRDVTGQVTEAIAADANADRLLIDGYIHDGAAAAGTNAAIALNGMDNPVIRNFKIVGNFADAAINCRTAAVVDLDIRSGYIWNKNAADVCIKDTVTGSTGRIGPDLELMLTDNTTNITEAVTGATFHLFDPVYVCNLVNEKAMLINWVASTDA